MKNTKPSLNPEHAYTMPNPSSLPTLDPSYGLYRFGLFMAQGKNAHQLPVASAMANRPFFVPYSAEDLRIIELAQKLGGFGPLKNLSPGASEEPADTHTQSPVPVKSAGRRNMP